VPVKSRVLLIAAAIRQNFFVQNFAIVLVNVLGKNDSNDTNLSLFDQMILLILCCLLFPHVNAKYDCVIWYSLVPGVKEKVFLVSREMFRGHP
jgi:hypothetical protein